MHPAKPMSRTRPRGPVQVLSFVTGKEQSLPQCLHNLKRQKVYLLRMVLAIVQKGIEFKICCKIKAEQQGPYKGAGGEGRGPNGGGKQPCHIQARCFWNSQSLCLQIDLKNPPGCMSSSSCSCTLLAEYFAPF